MFLFLPFIIAALLFGLWYYRRGSSLSAACRWRLERQHGVGHFRCVACGAEVDLPAGAEPRHCLRAPPPPPHSPPQQ